MADMNKKRDEATLSTLNVYDRVKMAREDKNLSKKRAAEGMSVAVKQVTEWETERYWMIFIPLLIS